MSYVYKTHKFKGYEISVSGAVYRRDEKGALRRVKGWGDEPGIGITIERWGK